MLVIVGLLVVCAAVLGGYAGAGGHLAILWQPFEFVIIFGAGLGAMVCSAGGATMKKLLAEVSKIVKGAKYKKDDYLELLCLLYQLFRLAKTKGNLGLEQHIENPHDSTLFEQYPGFSADHHAVEFTCDYLRLMILGADNPHEIEALMDMELEVHHQDELIAYRDQGFTSFKLKVGLDPEQDVALVRTAREVLGPGVNLRVDPNGAWTPATAKRMLAKLARYDLQYVEQPLPVEDLAGSAQLRASVSTPICIDEGAYTLQETMAVIRAGAADLVLVDPHEAGGLWACLKVGAVCEAAGIHVGMHSGGELGLTQAAYLHLAASMPNAKIALDTIYQHHADDILTERIRFTGGHADLPTGPGLGRRGRSGQDRALSDGPYHLGLSRSGPAGLVRRETGLLTA